MAELLGEVGTKNTPTPWLGRKQLRATSSRLCHRREEALRRCIRHWRPSPALVDNAKGFQHPTAANTSTNANCQGLSIGPTDSLLGVRTRIFAQRFDHESQASNTLHDIEISCSRVHTSCTRAQATVSENIHFQTYRPCMSVFVGLGEKQNTKKPRGGRSKKSFFIEQNHLRPTPRGVWGVWDPVEPAPFAPGPPRGACAGRAAAPALPLPHGTPRHSAKTRTRCSDRLRRDGGDGGWDGTGGHLWRFEGGGSGFYCYACICIHLTFII